MGPPRRGLGGFIEGGGFEGGELFLVRFGMPWEDGGPLCIARCVVSWNLSSFLYDV